MLEISENEPLKNHSTFRIGGNAKYFVAVKNAEEIKEAIAFAQSKNLPYIFIGSGSNILFRDEGYEGVVMKIEPHSQPLSFEERGEGVRLVVPAGTLLGQIVSAATEAGLSGLEWAIGIPGTVGGAVVDNTGAFGGSISESVVRVKTLNREYSKEECEFKYRDSKFKNLNNREVILEVELELKKGNPEEIKERIKINLAQRKNRISPYPSIGCIFKARTSNSLSAGKLIEDCGLKGLKIGDAQISEKHADIFINLSDTGSIDKAVLEAMASGCLVLTSNEAFTNILKPQYLTQKDPARLAEKII